MTTLSKTPDATEFPLAGALRELRSRRGWSQLDLAARLRTTQCSVSHWETAQRKPQAIRLETIERLCRAAGIIIVQ